MKRQLLAALMLSGAIACGDAAPDPSDTTSVVDERSQAAVVTPEFRLSGIGELPDALILEEVGLTITEIRLQPVNGSEVAYSTTRPFGLNFDLSEGETAIRGHAVEFPQTGRYLVSVRLEPLSPDERDELVTEQGAELPMGSLELNGLVQYGEDTMGKVGGEDEDGNPLPLPFERTRVWTIDESWTPFHYESQRAVFFALSNVELAPGEQTLVFNFDLNQWAISALDPIVSAVESIGSQGRPGEVIDISPSLDEAALGTEAMVRAASVSTMPSAL
ncbi:hypothetical protein FRC96_06450 [Lujinxingia vulgaris]|uniref:Uncharacterized protein n=1 Tax=Lujinxingia vulgaris TaxID=2600176 RepID=A0A5C6XES8_9DELT|nr:hypothetical protein [Lujinxingia vulgaris]TXD39907.1 hypothetical protein FRC96_06450 [Lujinxingia vulgaris]